MAGGIAGQSGRGGSGLYTVYFQSSWGGGFVLLALALGLAYFIGSGGRMVWARAWGCLAAMNVLGSLPSLVMAGALLYGRTGPDPFGDAIILALEVVGLIFLGVGLAALVLAVWQYRRVKRSRNKPSAETGKIVV